MNFSALIFSIDTIILVLFVYRVRALMIKEEIRKKYIQKAKISAHSALAEYFFVTALILAIGYFIFSIDLIFFAAHQQIFRFLKIAGDLFLFSSYAYGISIPLSIRVPKINRESFVKPLLMVSLLIIFYQILYYPSPEIIDGLVFWNVNPAVAWILYIYALAVWFPTGIIFFQEGLKLKNKEEFLRYMFLSASFIIISTTGPLMLVTRSELLIITSHIFMTIGYVFLFLGMFYQHIPKRYKLIHERIKKRS